MNERRSSAWRIGDRVSLCPNGNESDRVEATVESIDDGPMRGVRVRFDRPVRTCETAYASHDELTLICRAMDPEDHEPFASQAREADERWESGDRSTITTDEFRALIDPTHSASSASVPGPPVEGEQP